MRFIRRYAFSEVMWSLQRVFKNVDVDFRDHEVCGVAVSLSKISPALS